MTRLFVDNLTVLDFSYFHPTRGVVGESWVVDVELEGDLNDEGMVFDFGHVKKLLKKALDSGIDHTLVVPTKLAGLNIIHNADSHSITITFANAKNEIVFAYQCPVEAVFLIDADAITMSATKPLLEKHLNSLVPNNVKGVYLNLREEVINGDFYHYSHGLKKHLGDCQRLCHGHRSRIEIFKNNQRDIESERDWALKFSDAYLITDEDEIQSNEYPLLTHVGYDAQQGRFDVWLKTSQCYVMHTDSTVELIAEHIALTLKAEQPQHEWRVRAFEGVQKGAIAVA